MVGTLTDGNLRRALISGISLNDKIERAMHRNFNFLREVDNDVKHLHRQKEMKMRLIPILYEGIHHRTWFHCPETCCSLAPYSSRRGTDLLYH